MMSPNEKPRENPGGSNSQRLLLMNNNRITAVEHTAYQ